MRADFSRDPVSICVLAFSEDHRDNDHYSLIENCLASVIRHTDPKKYRLFIGCNNLSPRVMLHIDRICRDTSATKIIGRASHDRNRHRVYPKYPLMGDMFRRTASPWVIWLDDDSVVTHADWLERIERRINASPNVHQLGKEADVPLVDPPAGWIEQSCWYQKGRSLPRVRLADGSTRMRCRFIVGGFYVISRFAIDCCRLPDPRLFHNGGDWTTGLALFYQGLDIAHHTHGVAINTAPRRGMHDDAWMPVGAAAQLQKASIDQDKQLFETALAGTVQR